MSEFVKDSTLIFRGIQDKSDYSLLLEINRSSRQADHNPEPISLEDIVQAYTPSDHMNPARHVLIAFLAAEPSTAVGYSRVSWYSSCAENRLYYQVSFLRQEYRGRGLWEIMVQQNELRLREFAEEHPPVAQRYFQAWAPEHQVDWISALENTGYQVVRRFNNMLHNLEQIPVCPMPPGFEIRPAEPEHMRRIWEAQKEMNVGLFENADEDWLEEKYPAWLENPLHNPRFWQVAWNGGDLTGFVLARPGEGEYKNRGYTEHIYVRPPWRKRGLASALIARSLQVLKENGMHDVELGVDAENESAAFKLYQSLGYQTYYVDLWFRKGMG